MRFVVAGGVLLLSLLVGLFSYYTIPCFELKNNGEKGLTEYKTFDAITNATSFCRKKWREWIVICSSAALCTITTWVLMNYEIFWLDICKYSVVAVVLISVMIIDWKLHIIPNNIVLSLFFSDVVLLLIDFFVYRDSVGTTLLVKIISLVFNLVLFYVLARLTREGIGMGDVKIIAVLGWILGLSTTLIVVLFALLMCTVVSVFLLMRKKKNKNDTVPFGPFLFLGYILMLLLKA